MAMSSFAVFEYSLSDHLNLGYGSFRAPRTSAESRPSGPISLCINNSGQSLEVDEDQPHQADRHADDLVPGQRFTENKVSD